VTTAIRAFFEWKSERDRLTYDFMAMPNGHIACEVCSASLWCEHIEQMIKANGDAGVIFEDFTPGGVEDLRIEVPMFPTSNLWQPVVLTPHKKITAYFVDLDVDSASYELGFLNPGEGRVVLRSMVLSWFAGMVETSTLQCKSKSHGFPAQKAWEQNMKDEGARALSLFAVWQQGTCPHCLRQLNDPDLVPDAGDGGKKPWVK
jgi:hypothetical protein